MTLTRTLEGTTDWSATIDRLERSGLSPAEARTQVMAEWTRCDMDPDTTGPESRLVTELSRRVGR